jgi:hypothetical protein
MNWTKAMILALLGLCFAAAPITAAPIILGINDNSADETVSLSIDGTVGPTVTTILGPESFTLTAPMLPVHPPMQAFARFNLFEPDGVNGALSDTIDITMTPNNDATTSNFVMTFKSDPDATVPLTGAGTQNVVELEGGNILINANDGLRDLNGNLIPAAQIGGGPLTVVAISDINVPEPASFTLMGVGCLGIIGATWWRRKQAAA